jgi:ketosteroid isomerase-like protein
MVMTPEGAKAFAAEWVEAWNSHDLERIVGHFTDDVTFSSPLATQIIPGSEGVSRARQHCVSTGEKACG